MQKALATEADGVVFDLESAITRGTASESRSNVHHALEGHSPDQPAVFVRVSAVGTADFAADVDACRHPSLTTLMLPQVVSPDEVATADAALEGTETRIMPLVETRLRSAFGLRASHRLRPSGLHGRRHRPPRRPGSLHWLPVDPPRAPRPCTYARRC